MKSLIFTKMSGAGNTFLIIDARLQEVRLQIEKELGSLRSDMAVELCQGSRGAQADGLIFLENSLSADFKWDFYNSDGSSAEMCGNASRCVTQFFYDRSDKNKKQITFESIAGEIEGTILSDGRIQVVMPPVKIENSDFKIQLDGKLEKAFWVNTGVPHLVLEIPEGLRPERLREKAKVMRFHPALGEAGANATFYYRAMGGAIETISFERGVEDFTMACGTGAVAVAMAVTGGKIFGRGIEIRVPGGGMYVAYDEVKNRPLLIGDTEYLCDVRFY